MIRRLSFLKVSRHHCLLFRSESFTFHFQEKEFRVAPKNHRLTIA